MVRMSGYNGSIPGPTLTVGQGSETVVHLVNEGDLDTTVRCAGTPSTLDGPWLG